MDTFYLLDFYHAAIIGQTQCGKTWLSKRIVEIAPDYVIVDPDEEYGDICEHTLDEWAIEEVLEFIRDLAKEGCRIRVNVILQDDDDIELVAALCYDLQNIMFVFDEGHEFVSSHKIPKTLKRLARRGAKRSVQMLVISQRHTEMNRNFLSQCNLIVSFRQSLPDDIRHLERVSGVPLKTVLPNLLEREYICIWGGSLLPKPEN